MRKQENMSAQKWINSALIFILLPILGCSSTPKQGERSLSKDELPPFMRPYLSAEYRQVAFFEKTKNAKKYYEIKFFRNEKEISLSFDENGNQIEREEDVTLDSLGTPIIDKIKEYLRIHYPDAVILEVELRTDEKSKSFIDIEIRHKSSPSGYWELSFTPDGSYVSREIEDYHPIETYH